MKRPLLLFCISLIAGILVAYTTRSFFLIICSIMLFSLAAVLLSYRLDIKKILLTGVIIFYIVGSLEFLYIHQLYQNKFLQFSEKKVIVTGYIDSEPDIRDSIINYVVRVEKITPLEDSENYMGQMKETKGKILVTVYKPDVEDIYQYGQQLLIEGLLKKPEGRRNPGGFDYRGYLAQSGISATIFTGQKNIILGEKTSENIFKKMGFRLRAGIIDVINQSLPEQQAGLLNGMIIGYRKGLSDNVQEVFRDSGLSHIMAVSGANVAFIVFPLIYLFKKLKLKQRLANTIIIFILILFTFITGFDPSVVRAVIMGIILLIGQIIRREPDVFASISFAAILVLLFNPYTLFNIGFQLSFCATIALVLFYRNIAKIFKFKFIPDGVADVLAATVAAQAGVLPITAYYFNSISLVSVISNLIVVPVTGIVTILGLIMAVLGHINIVLSQFIGYVNSVFLTFILFISKSTAQLPFSVVRIVTPSFFIIILYYFLVIFFLWYKPLKKVKVRFKHFAVIFIVLTIAAGIHFFYPRGLEVVFIDVGAGDSAFIRTYSGKTVLIDGGGGREGMSNKSNIGDRIVIPFLLDYGVITLDLVVGTHGHSDHIQGLIPVLEKLRVKKFLMPEHVGEKEFEELMNIAKAKNIEVYKLESGDSIMLDDKTSFNVLNPIKDFNDKSCLNNNSVVLKLIYEDLSILFTGDIEQETENLLIYEDVSADVLKIAHHGSKTSTRLQFLRQVNPKVAVISVGSNSFGHPSEIVLKRLMNNGILTYRTDNNGAVIMKSDGDTVRVRKFLEGK